MAIGNLKEVITHVETLRAAMNEIASQLPEYPVVMAMKGSGLLWVLSLWLRLEIRCVSNIVRL